MGRSAVVSCEEIILLCEIQFSVAFYLVSAVHKFDPMLVINLTLDKWRQAEGENGFVFCQDASSAWR